MINVAKWRKKDGTSASRADITVYITSCRFDKSVVFFYIDVQALHLTKFERIRQSSNVFLVRIVNIDGAQSVMVLLLLPLSAREPCSSDSLSHPANRLFPPSLTRSHTFYLSCVKRNAQLSLASFSSSWAPHMNR